MAGPMGYATPHQQMEPHPRSGIEDSPRSSLHGYANPATGQGPSGGGSEYNVSVAESASKQQLAFERRLAWLEEDVAVLHRRLRDECENGLGGGKVSAAAGSTHDAELHSLVLRLDSELVAEQRLRETMEARLNSFEDALQEERLAREAHLRGFSHELETTMAALINRIDESLSTNNTPNATSGADATELRIRSLIQRVDEGLTAGAAALQDTLTAAGAAVEPSEAEEAIALASQSLQSPRGLMGHREVQPPYFEGSREPSYLPEQAFGPSRQSHTPAASMAGSVAFSSAAPSRSPVATMGSMPAAACAPTMQLLMAPAPATAPTVGQESESDHLIRDWDRLRQENLMLRERHATLQSTRQGTSLSAAPGVGAAVATGVLRPRPVGSVVMPSASTYATLQPVVTTAMPTYIRPAGQ